MTKKVKTIASDGGLGPKEIAAVRRANRQVWQWKSGARRLVLKRCKLPNGYSRCEGCQKRVPKVLVDHIKACGEVTDGGYLERLWVSSKGLQGLCQKCHDAKTWEERSLAKLGLGP